MTNTLAFFALLLLAAVVKGVLGVRRIRRWQREAEEWLPAADWDDVEDRPD